MASPQLDPAKIRKPIQLLAVLIVGLVLLVGMFLAAGAKVDSPRWARVMFFITAVALVPFFVGAVILMWTRFRVHLQDDSYYSMWLKRQERVFRDFKAENVGMSLPPAREEAAFSPAQGEDRRIKRYQDNQGVFLVHRWRPSTEPGQVADIVIEPVQHRDSALAAGFVESVTYYLGPKFFGGRPVTKRNARDGFRLEISAYGPVLCLAEVKLKGRKNPIVLERYIDFDEA